jgi:hypothetical protein
MSRDEILTVIAFVIKFKFQIPSILVGVRLLVMFAVMWHVVYSWYDDGYALYER